jgi:hypothetical protein
LHTASYSNASRFSIDHAGRPIVAPTLAELASKLLAAGAAPDDRLTARGLGFPDMVPTGLSHFDTGRAARARERQGRRWAVSDPHFSA